jgi:hypothetical protein
MRTHVRIQEQRHGHDQAQHHRIEAPSRDKAHLEVKRLAGEALSGAVGFEVDDLVTTREPVEPRVGVVTMVLSSGTPT